MDKKKDFLFAQRAKQVMTKGQTPLQEQEEGPGSGPYLLVTKNMLSFQLDWLFEMVKDHPCANPQGQGCRSYLLCLEARYLKNTGRRRIPLADTQLRRMILIL